MIWDEWDVCMIDMDKIKDKKELLVQEIHQQKEIKS